MKIEKHINTKKTPMEVTLPKKEKYQNTCTYNSYSNIKKNKKYIINNIIVVKSNQFITESQFTIELYVLEC